MIKLPYKRCLENMLEEKQKTDFAPIRYYLVEKKNLTALFLVEKVLIW